MLREAKIFLLSSSSSIFYWHPLLLTAVAPSHHSGIHIFFAAQFLHFCSTTILFCAALSSKKMKNNFIFHLMAKFIEFLRYLLLIFFLPFFRQPFQNTPISWSTTTKCKTAIVVHLPLETFAEILQFASVDDLNQQMVFVSRPFAALSLQLLRRRFEVRISAWTKDFVSPIDDQLTFERKLKLMHISLVYAIVINSIKPCMVGIIQVLPILPKMSKCKLRREAPAAAADEHRPSCCHSIANTNIAAADYSKIFKQRITIEWRANGAKEWNLNSKAIVPIDEDANRYLFRIDDIPVDNANKGAILEFRLHYYIGGPGEHYFYEDFNHNKYYQFKANRQNCESN